MPGVQTRQFYIGGMDGTGKTTQATLLKGYVESKGQRARVYHIYGFFLRRLLGLVVKRNPGSRTPRTDVQAIKARTNLTLSIIQILRILDTVLYAIVISTLIRIRGEFAIFDRSYYDYYLRYRSHGQTFPLLEIVSRIFMPRHGVVLDAPPEVVYERKPEFSVNMFKKQRKLYHQMARALDYPVVSSVGSVESVFGSLREIVDGLQ